MLHFAASGPNYEMFKWLYTIFASIAGCSRRREGFETPRAFSRIHDRVYSLRGQSGTRNREEQLSQAYIHFAVAWVFATNPQRSPLLVGNTRTRFGEHH